MLPQSSSSIPIYSKRDKIESKNLANKTHPQRCYHVRVSVEDGDRRRRLQAPDPDQLVATADGEQTIVEADGHVVDFGGVASKSAQETARSGAPHLDEVVVRALSQF